MNKRGAFTDVFLFMVISIIILLISAVFIYMGGLANTKMHEQLDDKIFGNQNGSEIVSNTIGAVNQSYQALYWISVFLMVGMILSIFIGSYLVTTKPIFFVPYIIVTIVAIIVSAGLSNAYEMVIADPTLASTFEGFVGANYIMAYLPIWITVISFIGGLIMFVRMGSREETSIYG